MELTTFNEPARVFKQGEQVFSDVVYPTHVKLQMTGPGSGTYLDVGPESGKKWQSVLVRVEIREVDA